jgi:type I restriction enzyme S subunit
MTDAIDLTTEQRNMLNDLLHRFLPGVAVWAYGSRVKWTARPNSDLDLVAFATPAQHHQVAEIKDALAESNLPFPVDIHVWDDVPERFREIICKEYVVVQEAKPTESSTSMPSEWREWPLGKLVEIFDGPHATPAKTQVGPIFLGISNLAQGRVNLNEVEHLSEDDYVRWTRRVEPRAGDVVFSYETRLGEAARIPPGLRCCLGRRMGLLRARSGEIDERFLLYAYLGPQFQEILRGRTVPGSTVDRIPLIDMPQFPMVVPSDLDEQRAIAHILGTLDDKIELNRKMNETLETIARALFKSWFVDFDPVRAKAEGQDIGLPKPIDDLFPGSFEESELGEIPRGWEIGSILKHARLISGGTPKTDRPEYWDGPIAWASAKDVSQANDLFLVDTERSITERGLDESATQVVPAFCSAVVARGATTGRMALFGRDMAMNQTCYALATTTETPFALYCRLRQEIDALVHAAHGSVFDTITTSSFVSSRIVLPPSSVVKAFETQIAPLFQKVLSNVRASHTLTALRETLLPKLISGQLRVPASTMERVRQA